MAIATSFDALRALTHVSTPVCNDRGGADGEQGVAGECGASRGRGWIWPKAVAIRLFPVRQGLADTGDERGQQHESRERGPAR